MPRVDLTLNEAGYVVGRSSAAINRAVDSGLIRTGIHERGKARLRTVGPAELRYLAIAGHVGRDLTPAARRRVYEAMRRLPPDVHGLDVGVMTFRLTEIDRGIAERLERLKVVKAMVEERPGLDPVLRETNVSPYVIAALTRGQTPDEIVADFPGLTHAQVEAAVDYAKVYPKVGRPLPARTFKRMLTDLAEAGVWDADSDDEPVAPHLIL